MGVSTEERVINAICQNKDFSAVIQHNGIDELFVTHKDIWLFIKSQWQKYHAVPDPGVILERFGEFEVKKVTEPTAFYLDELRNEYITGKIRETFLKNSGRLGEEAGEKILASLYKDLSGLNQFTESVRDLDVTDLEAAEKYYQELSQRAASMGGSPGIPTGFRSIDVCYPTGQAPGHLIYIIGWPSRKKSFFSEFLACKVWEQGFSPMIVSLEMSPENVRDRIYTLLGSGLFNMSDFSRGDISIDDFSSWGKKKLAGKPKFNIISSEGETDITPNTIQAKIDQYRPSWLSLDYHQLFTDNAKSRSEVEKNRNISKEFKRLAVGNGIPVVDITAATMEDISDQDKPPLISQCAWSKSIEYDADLAIAVHGDKDTDIVEVVGRKNRHGSLFSMFLDFKVDQGLIEELYID